MYGSEAALREFNPKTRENPVTLGDMNTAEQNRSFNIIDADDKIVWGAFPNYGRLGGAVAVYDKNKKETQVRVSTVGDFKLLSGNVVELVNHGKFDGKYLIEKSTHKIDSSGYTVDLELRKCLNGY